MNSIFDAYRRFLDFGGRSTIPDYLIWGLFQLVVFVLCLIFEEKSVVADDNLKIGPVLTIFLAVSVLPNLALTVRRLHDADFSGWWIFITMVPFVGSLILLMLCLIPGTKGENRFGPSPRKGDGLADQQVIRKGEV